MQPLADGLVLRPAGPHDVEAIMALVVAGFQPADEPAVRTDLVGPAADLADWTVVLDGDRVVAASALLRMPLVVDDVVVPAGRIEHVVTAPSHRRRGLVRAQVAHHHRRSALRGDRLQVIAGIPWFYRRFGYGYGISFPSLLRVTAPQALPAGMVVRPATSADEPALQALEADRPRHLLRVARGAATWARAFDMTADERGFERLVVAEAGGSIRGWAWLTVRAGEGKVAFLPGPATEDAAVDALVAHGEAVAAATTPPSTLVVYDSPGSPAGRRLHEVGSVVGSGVGLYVRVSDPVAVLRDLRSVLSARLASSAFAHESGSVAVTTYESGFRIGYAGGEVTAIEPAPAMEDPDDATCGVAPDALGALVLGRWGAAELERRSDDVLLGPQGPLLDALFPRRAADVAADL